jgi:hypothetical protein
MDSNEQRGLEVVRQAVDQILNVNANLKRRTRKEFDKQRELFIQIIHQLEAVTNRSTVLFADLKVDFSTYDEGFLEILDMLLLAKYGKECFELISFYLWERLNPDQTFNTLIGPEGEEITLQSPLDLWNLMLKVNPKLEK